MKNKRFISGLLVVLFLFSITIQETLAKWPDNSSDLPGVSTGAIIGIAAGGAVIITGIIILTKINKNKEKETDNSSAFLKSYMHPYLTKISKSTSLYNELRKASEQTPMQLIVVCNNMPNLNCNTSQALSVGVRIRF